MVMLLVSPDRRCARRMGSRVLSVNGDPVA